MDHFFLVGDKMTDESNEVKEQIRDDDEVLFENYIHRKHFGSKFWLYIIMVIVFILAAILYKNIVIDEIIPPEELIASIEIFDIDSQWVVKEEVNEKDFKGIVLVPQISFRFRNVGKRNLRYIYVLGVFRILNRPKALGEGNKMALRKPLKPGEESDRIVLTSSFGYRATSKKAFVIHQHQWRRASAEIYVKSGSSNLSFLKSFYIIRKIEGFSPDIEVKIA
jgi:hypothetical protein